MARDGHPGLARSRDCAAQCTRRGPGNAFRSEAPGLSCDAALERSCPLCPAGGRRRIAIKESSPDSRRFTDVWNAFGSRFTIFAGLDDLAFEGLALGASGWVSGLTNAFPQESPALYAALHAGDLERARAIYRWFMPLLHLDAGHDLVQAIKLAEQCMGRGSERVRPPRLPLAGPRREEVIRRVEQAAATRHSLIPPASG